MTTGFAVRKLDRAVRAYVDLMGLGTSWILPTKDWRVFYAWVLSKGMHALDVVVVTDMSFVPYLDYVKDKLGSKVVCLELDEPVSWPEADAHYTSHDLGWGVDKIAGEKVGRRREWRRYPVFYLTEEVPAIEERLVGLGHHVVKGEGNYALGNVAIVPSKRVVPWDIYEAMATGMAVVTTVENDRWMEGLPGFGVRLEEGVDAVVNAVVDSDFKLLGMMAQETVPDLSFFKERLVGKLKVW